MNTKNRIILAGLLLFCSVQTLVGQVVRLERVEPPTWWIGMETASLQLLVYGENISLSTPTIDYPGVEIKSVTTLESPNYLFVNLNISAESQPGSFAINFMKGKKRLVSYEYQIQQKSDKGTTGQTVDGSDVIYLITPDRFANGERENDSTDDTIEKANREDTHGRHGGDIKGIVDHLKYVQELGATTLWMNPFLENDQPAYSYHGYGISDFYRTDSRFGSNEDFRNLTKECHDRGMKMIMDQVFNHCGTGHWWMNDLPANDWLNQWDTFTRSSFTNIAASDPHVSQSDYDLFTKGWFDKNLPDLNLHNEFLATYLIQNSIWWIEYAQLDGIRMDTYPYPDKQVMADWVKRVKLEYPDFYIVAETWESKASSLSYWNRIGPNADGYNPRLNSVCDYPLYYAMLTAFGQDGNVYKLYETLAEDFIYGDASNNKIFNGNHDVPRLYTLLDEDMSKVKLSMAFTLTTRGIPQLYYGDEILLAGDKPDGVLRKDFPGGWESDVRNAFSKNGRTTKEEELYRYVNTILKWRKNAKEIHKGRLTHFQPYDNVYVYFRSFDERKTMVIINNNDRKFERYQLDRFEEALEGYTRGTDIITNTTYLTLEYVDIQPNSALIIELIK
ncbi:Glycosidase [Reichenbachiella faecimaris]|uniref:Glycosidase n=1 Tax=Reichenbachiella faecimaris TaxID=692418 RepID=A0A1W2G8N1_REIFA|nr:glycoside hydrolase family 13 protein [Reichenbachiella faecimaris]SMD32688.1 Glycosidase [Reichenbachiella faecimaris]